MTNTCNAQRHEGIFHVSVTVKLPCSSTRLDNVMLPCSSTCLEFFYLTHAFIVQSLSCVWLWPHGLQLYWSEVKSLNHVQLFVTSWTVAYNAPPSMGFSRQEYWNGLPFECPGNLNSLNKILDNMCQPYKQWLFRQWEMQALGSVEMDSWSLV